MLKAIIVGCAMCAGAGATAYWVTSSDNAAAQSTANSKVKPDVADSNMQSVIQALHSKIHQDGLPIQVIIEDPI
jgi:3-hydroxy-3-methylglutaryl CoA synthase